MNYKPYKEYPEAMAMILLAIIEATPRGGITINQLLHIYESVVGVYPCYRTIYRIIRRLNEAIDPNAYDYPELPIQGKRHTLRAPKYYTYQRNPDNYTLAKILEGGERVCHIS